MTQIQNIILLEAERHSEMFFPQLRPECQQYQMEFQFVIFIRQLVNEVRAAESVAIK